VNVSSNKLSRLPDSLFSLPHLKHLDASNNLIEVLQPKVSLLKNLTTLLLEGNRLGRLPNSLGYLNDLTQISCDIFGYIQPLIKDVTID